MTIFGISISWEHFNTSEKMGIIWLSTGKGCKVHAAVYPQALMASFFFLG